MVARRLANVLGKVLPSCEAGWNCASILFELSLGPQTVEAAHVRDFRRTPTPESCGALSIANLDSGVRLCVFFQF